MSESSSSGQVDFFNLCKDTVRSIEDILASCEDLLNKRQCQDLSSKLAHTAHNVGELLDNCRASADVFRRALEDLYRYLEKAKLLVRNCAEKDWCAAAVFQCQNENAFQEIVLEVGLCYNAIYELAKSQSQEWKIHPEDLRQSSVFVPSMDSDVDEDNQDLQKRLDALANGHSNFHWMDYFRLGKVAREQSLARYLLLKMYCTSKEPEADTLDTYSAIIWAKVSEPSGTWGSSRFLGAGSGASGVCSTEWLGVPCAKKEFHGEASVTSFSKEAGILAHLKHPRIVNFICCGNGHERGDRFIAMELMEKSLLDLIEEQKGEHFSVPVAVDMMVQMARGVSYLHSQGVAHRDLKPGNVVVNRLTSLHLSHRFCVKLVDFGISKTKVDVLKSNTMTYRGLGTTMYRAPEAHPKANPNGTGKVNWFKADAFSFAMTCAHLLYLEDKKATEFYTEVTGNVTGNAQRWEVCDKYPQDLIALLKDCWKIKPQSRPSFTEICTRLEVIHHKFLMGHSTSSQCSEGDKVGFDAGSDFIVMKLNTSIKSPLDDKAEDVAFDGVVSAISCACRRALEILPQSPPYYDGLFSCNICFETGDGEVYHCETCQFDAHPACAEIKDNVKVAFHDHTFHLLVQNYHNDNPDAICYSCEESVQDSEWVYRCEQCDFDLHALCTKFPRKLMWKEAHPHLLTLSQCPPRKTLVCSCCNGKVKEYTWRYTCQLQSCVFDLHPLCNTVRRSPLCIFDSSHRLSPVNEKMSFHCGRCDAPGFSWYYRCNHCNLEFHTDCVYDLDEERFDWNGTQEKFMIEYGANDNHTKINMIVELLEKVPGCNSLESNSSSSRQPLGTTSARVPIERLALTEKSSFDESMDVSLQRMIGVKTEKRIEARKMAAKEARKESRANTLEMLEKLEKIVVDLRSCENMSQDDAVILAATHEELKRRHDLVKEQIAMQGQSKMCQGPRMAVFYQDQVESNIKVLLTRLRADMNTVCFALLCEEPGGEHTVELDRVINGEVGEKLADKLQPLLACGLQAVMRAMNTLEPHELTGLGSITLPCLGEVPWDLRAIEMDDNSSLLFEDHDEMEALNRAADSAAEWLRSHLESHNENLLRDCGLQRVRYKVTEERDSPRFRRGTRAWVCTEHLNSGLLDGTLESCPLKYFNVEDDYLLRCPV